MKTTSRKIFYGFGRHVFLVLVLLGLVYWMRGNGFSTGALWGITTKTWVLLTLAVTILHQFYVWFCWRTELHMKLLSKSFGKSAYTVYVSIFFIFMLLRPVLLFALAIANRETVSISLLVRWVLSILLAFMAIYTCVSIKRYFGFMRAPGKDHFDEECRKRPMVKKGIFAWCPNPMYVFGVGAMWIPGIIFASRAALALALFMHLYIWVHYYLVEKVDLKSMHS
ncbi:MAG: hypothetical protein GY750_08375 [Lentisphaerae bacterium]|nr:hypothetical protein [Lentisphaerota bacterium]MCP4101425.1 hypothetical protein [Lentisphaerota bacterium]